ncbi:hypothetical protein GCM10008955_30190 [Deinococcus malanensis]|uniref:Uncharacterized protein n=1 Tax=Deinococcus malanensis TaxID=1706855 RepID=A0ABQ2F2T4_9DEIO|nr:hypothetical protein [Deinococcus malanensis]GGK34084.1 hypothetical protein GCM10008955_30190 [Deinococcus malanensis]
MKEHRAPEPGTSPGWSRLVIIGGQEAEEGPRDVLRVVIRRVGGNLTDALHSAKAATTWKDYGTGMTSDEGSSARFLRLREQTVPSRADPTPVPAQGTLSHRLRWHQPLAEHELAADLQAQSLKVPQVE